jgi:hypothetical protein
LERNKHLCQLTYLYLFIIIHEEPNILFSKVEVPNKIITIDSTGKMCHFEIRGKAQGKPAFGIAF